MVNFCPLTYWLTIDWTDKTLTQALVLIHLLSTQNYREDSDTNNMKNHFIKVTFVFRISILIFISTGVLTACVSVSVPFGPVPKSEKASVKIPNSPFASLVTSTADQAWISEKTGNTISYLSECKKNNTEKIEDVAIDATKAIDQSKIITSNHGLIDSHESSEVVVIGKVDSHKIKMAISVFKNDDCIFSLTYGGLEQNFDSEFKEFELFKLGFHVP